MEKLESLPIFEQVLRHNTHSYLDPGEERSHKHIREYGHTEGERFIKVKIKEIFLWSN